MSVYKEAIHAISTIKKNSRRIYPDACDFGAPVKKGDALWNLAKQLVEWYGVEGTRKLNTYTTGTTVSHAIQYMPNEHSSAATKIAKVVFVTTRRDKNMDGYVYIN